jgi:hypothetical protein
MRKLARLGAAARLTELNLEVKAILAAFPDLRSKVSSRRSTPRSERSRTAATTSPRKRPKMSAAARRAISKAQKARWAKWRQERS